MNFIHLISYNISSNYILVANGGCMAQIDDLIRRFLSIPTDFSYRELKRILGHFDYKEVQGSGSRVRFSRNPGEQIITLHMPHGKDPVKPYLIRVTIQKLKVNGDL